MANLSVVDDQLSMRLARVSLHPDSALDFSNEQRQFIDLAVTGRRNLLLVAPAGYGKSAVIRTIVEKLSGSLCRINGQAVVGLCAPTGKAASLIDGRTIHSYLGIKLGHGSAADWVKQVSHTTAAALRGVQAMIIDEVSMVGDAFFDKISAYLQLLRNSPKPFGGVQIILVGDLCQLKPVAGTFIFRSREYERANFQPFQFTQCFRQEDPAFLALLTDIRFGQCSQATLATLRGRTSIDPAYSNGIAPLRLASVNKEVDAINERDLRNALQLSNGLEVAYPIRSELAGAKAKVDKYLTAATIARVVRLAVDCPVLVTRNLGNGLVNGSQGTVTRTGNNCVQLQLRDGSTRAIEYVDFLDPEDPDVLHPRVLFRYLPVRLAYATTVHKAQGMTLDVLDVDLKNSFEHGMAYTALSRVKDLRGLVVRSVNPREFKCDPAVVEFYAELDRQLNAQQPDSSIAL